jgi:hypothetical protein
MYVGDFVQNISVKMDHVQITLILENTKKGYWVIGCLYIYIYIIIMYLSWSWATC